MAIARLRDGVTIEAANAELASLGTTPFTMLRPPAEGVKRSLVLQDLHATVVDDARQPILMLAWAVGAVLLIACVNITALLMARSGTRVKEIATRMALGGGRTAVIRQLMVESLVLAAAGGACGVLVAMVGLEGLRSIGGTTFSEWDRAGLDLRTVAASFALAGSVLVPAVPAVLVSTLSLLGLVANALPITPGGVGVGEATAEALFRAVGVAGGAALVAAWRVGMLGVCVVGAGLYAFGHRGSRRTSAAPPALEKPAAHTHPLV